MPKAAHYSVVVIGTGFGGTMTALPVAREFVRRNKGETVLMLERGTWWTTPVGTVQDKEVQTFDFLTGKKQPVQYWSTPNHFSGFLDIFTRCFRHRKNEDGLYDLSFLGRTGLLGIFGRQNDGVSVIRACGVGGGSLVYSNITIRPPNFIFQSADWPLSWTNAERDGLFDLARNGIGRGILWALEQPGQNLIPPAPGVLQAGTVNTGLSNINTRTAGLNPHWIVRPDPNNSRGLKQIQPSPNPVPPGTLDANNDLWIDRARLFQMAISQLTPEFGAVDLAINDFDPADPSNQYVGGKAKNYCERQGRCNVGCLPGARHTLNKQLMAAIFGGPGGVLPIFKKNEIEIAPLAEVDVIIARPAGGYEIRYAQRDKDKPWVTTSASVTADRVVVAAGCLGTSEIMLRSKTQGTLPNLSDRTGYGFSTNGDYIAFLEETKFRMRMTRGPVTTSFGHFNTGTAATGMDTAKFHNIEDQGIPPALATIVGSGVPFIRQLSGAYHHLFFILMASIRWAVNKIRHAVRALFQNFAVRQDIFESDDEILAKMLCVVGQGRDAASGQFRLGTNSRDTPLRVHRADGEFWQDPIYAEIEKTLDKLAPFVADNPASRFQNPFLSRLTRELEAESITVAHPLGGCRMAKDASGGVVDEYGRVFDKSKSGAGAFYHGLYIADASIIPSALGVNPSLTITTLSLRVARKIIEELP